jgi:uncharacterized membrane protein YeaQ/YmgE (transglycosylase-associated protein family)
MTGNVIFSWMLCGLIVGLVARLLVRKRLQVGVIMTMVLGIIGGIVGGLLYSMFLPLPTEPFSLSGTAWHSWIAAIFGGVIVLFAWGGVYPKSWWRQ